ncbi:DUF7281 domain-containing protein [Neptunicella sp.]|uniref:DUF7281 domain-containing protein n=1 Tax=Neptunicella sp. TaxID=2125986 RepID=UPI003F692C9A
MALSKTHIAQLSGFFCDHSKLHLSNKGKLADWLRGYIDIPDNGKELRFDSKLKRQLRIELEKDYPNINFLRGLPKDLNRLEMAGIAANEKLAALKPDDDVALITSQQPDLNPFGISCLLPVGCSLRVNVAQLDLANIRQLIIVENLDIIDYWHLACLPTALQNALVVYRGHEKSISGGLKTLLTLLPAQCQVIMFADLDPKGLEIAFTTPKVNQLLAPSQEGIEQLLNLKLNQPDLHIKQHASIGYLRQQNLPLISQLLEHNIALMQQHMLAHKIVLTLYPIDKNESYINQ